jgi:hypothetical protein
MIHKPGIVYATAPDGLELPVIDITHPDFAIADDHASRAALIEQYKLTEENNAKGPVFLRRIFMKLGARRSQLLRALIKPSGSYLGGLTTYLMKVGADNLPDGYDTPLDKRIAGSPHARFVRLRLQHCATMLADGLEPLLTAAPEAPLHFINIGGGPAMDSINALLLLRKRQSQLFARPIHIHVCDLDTKGPAFASNAIAALTAPGAPLEGVAVTLERIAYNWNQTAALESLLSSIHEPDAFIVASSEGALFEYGTDEAILANLRVLHGHAKLVVGSITGSQPLRRKQIRTMRFALYPRGLDGFRPLAEQAGYTVDRSEIIPLSDQVTLRPR